MAKFKTPENQMIDTTSHNNNLLNFNNYSESLSSTSFCPVNDNFVRSSEDPDEIPLDRTEWQIIDSSSGRKRPPRQNEFLELLLENRRYSSYICWLNKNQGLFQILLP